MLTKCNYLVLLHTIEGDSLLCSEKVAMIAVRSSVCLLEIVGKGEISWQGIKDFSRNDELRGYFLQFYYLDRSMNFQLSDGCDNMNIAEA